MFTMRLLLWARPFIVMTVMTLTLWAGGGVVVVKNKKFLAEVALTTQEQARGLMYRQSLAENRCMIFLYDNDQPRPIWMKNCLISLDVAWVDRDGRIVGLMARIPPCPPTRGEDCPTYGEQFIARHFIEFSAGTIARYNLKVGDRLSWDLTLDDGRRVKSPMLP
ncbi:MAG: DUF192 domain-containing protein [Holophagaceae bacterium]|jgi:uncharacterized membrane protein (UPF0127 family)